MSEQNLSPLDDPIASQMLEMLLQWGYLSGSRAFILIETPSGRWYGGEDNMTKMFKSGHMKPCGKDTELEIDPDLCHLKLMNEIVGESGKENADKLEPEEEFTKRRHVGELPSERKERRINQYSEKAVYNKLVGLSKNIGKNLFTFFMEMFTKYASISDVQVFLMIELNIGRRFAGSKDLIDAYLAKELLPTETDVHVGVDRENYYIPIKRHGEEEEQMEVNDVEEEGGKPKVSASEGPRKEKRPHVGELPSERKERMKAEGTWNPPAKKQYDRKPYDGQYRGRGRGGFNRRSTDHYQPREQKDFESGYGNYNEPKYDGYGGFSYFSSNSRGSSYGNRNGAQGW